MQKQIFKYQLAIGMKNVVLIPEGAELLTVQAQKEIACIWALVNPNGPLVERTFEIYPTGFAIECKDVNRKYIGTFQIADGSLVFHLFEIFTQTFCGTAKEYVKHKSHNSTKRQIFEIASEIRGDWKSPHPLAVPCIDKMFDLKTVNDNYFGEPAERILNCFLARSSGWEGETARKIKRELIKLMVK